MDSVTPVYVYCSVLSVLGGAAECPFVSNTFSGFQVHFLGQQPL